MIRIPGRRGSRRLRRTPTGVELLPPYPHRPTADPAPTPDPAPVAVAAVAPVTPPKDDRLHVAGHITGDSLVVTATADVAVSLTRQVGGREGRIDVPAGESITRRYRIHPGDVWQVATDDGTVLAAGVA